LLLDERAEPNDRFRPAGALVDRPETFIQLDLRIPPRRQVRHGPEQDSDAPVRWFHQATTPARDPHLAPFAFL
jgi:hypothetical protein